MSCKPHILIRCDGGPQLGWGHVVRSLALAERLAAQGAHVTFATWADNRDIAEKVRLAGFARVCTGPAVPRNQPLELGDLQAVLSAAGAIGAAAVLVDHYQADARYLAGIAEAGFGLAIIDDVGDRDLRQARWLLNQNPCAERLTYALGEDACVLRGPRFSLLRPQFLAARKTLRRSFGPQDTRVLITLGGGDMGRHVAAVVEALSAIPRRLQVRCVVGGRDASGNAPALLTRSTHDVTVVTNVSDMAAEMSASDVSVNAGGSTCWELACLGVPMVTVSLSDDQSDNVSELHSRGIAVGLGVWHDGQSPATIASAVNMLLDHPDRRADMSASGMALVDGQGVNRSAESLIQTFALEGVRA